MKFPLKKYRYNIPTGIELGAFGVTRKHDMHTGVDLYCEQGDEVICMEDGIIVNIAYFTGPSVNMPWWNDTQAVAIKGASDIINYGEIIPLESLKVGQQVKEGDLIGHVTPVLKKDKGKVPSINMLHVERYKEYNGGELWALWEVGTPQPDNLVDPTGMLSEAYILNFQLKHCEAGRDGECFHMFCPQLRDNEPKSSGRGCPLYTWNDDDDY